MVGFQIIKKYILKYYLCIQLNNILCTEPLKIFEDVFTYFSKLNVILPGNVEVIGLVLLM